MAPSTPTNSSRRPRRKRRPTIQTGSNVDLLVDPNDSASGPAFPLVAFLWPARSGTSQWLILPLILMAVGLFRWATGLWGHSGYGNPPMHGDFEAQRHWMELTIHLPISSWYFYDLQYWGLDYPPLTAYHSWLLGKIGNLINPTWFALDESRGSEDPLLKVFMRATVVVSEYLVYIPAVVIFIRRFARRQGVGTWASSTALVAVLMQPATILIDHGHFQFNTVMLGLMVATLESLFVGRTLWTCVFFVGALGFKQMALYYSPIIFVYLLAVCFSPRIRLGRLFSIASVTVVAFALLLSPLLAGSIYNKYRDVPIPTSTPPLLSKVPFTVDESSWIFSVLLQLSQCIHRVFPFARGLFEDKVANAWCAIHTVYKLNRFSTDLLKLASLGATLLSIAAPCAVICRYPRPQLLPLALASTAWGFFLFSFQVHEKSVLLPLLPMTLLYGGAGGLSKTTRAWVGLANMLGVWTLFPLLKRDELRVPYFVLSLLWAYLLGLPPTSLRLYRSRRISNDDLAQADDNLHITTKLLHLLYYTAMISWHILEAFAKTPETKPDLWVVLNALIGASGFGIMYLWCTWTLIHQAFQVEHHSPVGSSKASLVGDDKKKQ